MPLVRANAKAIPLRDRCVQTVVTSPPYWGLRDYGLVKWVDGDPHCTHSPRHSGANKGHVNEMLDGQSRFACHACGATRVETGIGLEATPDAYVAALADTFQEVWRVLRDDGTVWLNLGDCYAATTKGSGGHSPKQDSNVGSR